MSLTIARTFAWSLSAVLLAAGLQSGAAAETGPVGVYQHPDGPTYFSLSLSARPTDEVQGHNIVVLMDTSASQTGMYRESAFAALEGYLSALGAEDRVLVMAADLDARAMNARFAPAGSAEVAAGVEKLHSVAPLGATDMHQVLKTAAQRLSDSGAQNRVVIYLGDGKSNANLLKGPEFQQLCQTLRQTRVSVNSYAIGPACDAELLAAVANQSGGNLYVNGPITWADDQGVSPQRASQENARRGASVGRTLAEWTQAAVAWPQNTRVDESVRAIYPAVLPPLRSDRDSIVVGRVRDGASRVSISAQLDSHTPVEWQASLPAPNEAHAYLAELVTRAEADNGVSLPTLGTAGLNEVARVLNASVEALTEMAEKAVATGDKQGAEDIADAVLRRDPGNLRAKTVKRVTAKQISHREELGDNPDDLSMVRVAQAAETVPPPAPGDPIIMDQGFDAPMQDSDVRQAPPMMRDALSSEPPIFIDQQSLPPAGVVADDELLSAVEQQNRVMSRQLQREVQVVIGEARDTMSNDPERAISQLKLMLQSVESAPELIADVRASLTDRLETALRQASRAASIKDELDREREEAISAARERLLMLDRMDQTREREAQLMDRFNAMMDEGQYADAESVAEIVMEIDPYGVTPVAADQWAELSRWHTYNQTIRARRAKAYIESMAATEEAAIPFPGEPPIVYPDAEFWREITNRRKKYEAVGITGESDSEQRIATALSSSLTSAGLDFADTPLEDVVEFLRAEYGIEIQLDQAALDDLGIGTDEPITVNLRNISLRSALRIMLKQLELTYIIADEVLLITTEEEAESRLVVKVYNVGDLVIDKTPIAGIGGGGGGGFGGGGGGFGGGGGGFGGGGGGFGGGGGGFGGGGQGGFGGGGGAFAVPDDLVMVKGAKPDAVNPAAQQPAKTRRASSASAVKIDSSVPADQFWNEYFQTPERDAAAVRATVRKLMRGKRYDHAIALVQNALRAGQPQPWMYEALGIALQLSGASPQDIERAIMSAADFSTTADELMLVALYLEKLQLDQRAVQVLKQVAVIDPTRYEAYQRGLRIAEKTGEVDAVRWATTGILSRDWPEQLADLEQTARHMAAATLRRLEEAGRMSERDAFAEQLASAAVRDCLIRVTWTGDADLDLRVQEPDGAVCSLTQPRTPGGGMMLGDTYATGGEPGLQGYSETYICPRGFNGEYFARIDRVWGDVTAGAVTVDVYTGYGGPNQQHQRGQLALKDGTAAVKFTLDSGRRDEPLNEQQLAQAIDRQQTLSQAVLAQQLSSLSDPRVNTLRPDEVARLRQRQLAGGRGGAVGFQPVITVLPAGTQFLVNAVTTADRRYVIVRPSPSFTNISDVSTFTFAGASRDVGDDGDDGDDDGGAGDLNLGPRGPLLGDDDN